jgi:RNA polymerase sigma factor (sigma-70 family)
VSRTATLDRVVGRLKTAASDPDLLAAFTSHRDPNAFQQIVDRYAPLVGGLCRRALRDEHAAEDAAQLTFLALSRRPGAVRGDALAGWLCAVARRTCQKLCRSDRRRSTREAVAARREAERPVDELSVRDLLTVLDEEVARLPADARSALLVCYWQGEPQAVAARQLGRTPAAVKGLLERGRARLLARLARRGVTADIALRALLVAPAGLALLPAGLLAEWHRAAIRPPSPISKFGTAVGGIAMTSAVVGLGLWLAALPAQGPPATPPPKVTPAPPATIAKDVLGDPLPESALLRLGTLRFRHPNNAHELALSADGKMVATSGSEAIIFWEATTGKELWRVKSQDVGVQVLPGTSYGCRSLAFTPDGRLVAPGRPGAVSILNPATRKIDQLVPKRATPVGPAAIKSIDVSPDGKLLALGSEAGVTVCTFDGTVRFEVANTPGGPPPRGDDRLWFGGHFGYAVFAPKGQTLAVVTSDAPDIVRLLDAATGEERRRIDLSAHCVRLAFTPDGATLFATERDQSVRAYTVADGKRVWAHAIKLTNPYENYTSAVAVRPDGKTVAVGATDNDIYLLDAAKGDEVGRLKGHGWYPWCLAFTADGATLFSSGWDGPIRRWDVAARKQLPLPVGVRGSSVVAAAHDGKTVAYEDDGDTIRLIDAATGAERQILRLDGASYNQLQFSPDGKRLAGGGTSGDDVHVAVWELPSGKLLRRWDWPKGRDPHSTVECLSFTPDGSRLAAAVFRQSAARIWDIEKDREVAQLPHPMIYGLSFSPDGRTLATAGWDKRIRFWNPDTAKVDREMEVKDPHNPQADTRLYAVCYAPAGGLIAVGDMNLSVRVFNVSDMSLRATIRMDGSFIFGALEFSPDGLWIATGLSGGELRVWDARSGEKVWDRGKHGGYVHNVAFGGDGRTLISGANDGVGYLWDLRPPGNTPGDPVVLWNELGKDGPAAYRAMWGLVDMPAATILLLREKMRPAPPADPARVRKWIGDLDDARFAIRSAAQTELSKLGSRATIPLREALTKATSAEQRDRLSKLLDEIVVAGRPVEVRNRQVISVVTWIGTPEARALLEEWAKADPDGALGAPAATALKRWP